MHSILQCLFIWLFTRELPRTIVYITAHWRYACNFRFMSDSIKRIAIRLSMIVHESPLAIFFFLRDRNTSELRISACPSSGSPIRRRGIILSHERSVSQIRAKVLRPAFFNGSISNNRRRMYICISRFRYWRKTQTFTHYNSLAKLFLNYYIDTYASSSFRYKCFS